MISDVRNCVSNNSETWQVNYADYGNFSTSVCGTVGEERGIDPSTYYIEITNAGTTTALGIIDSWWESLPSLNE